MGGNGFNFFDIYHVKVGLIALSNVTVVILLKINLCSAAMFKTFDPEYKKELHYLDLLLTFFKQCAINYFEVILDQF